MNLKNLLLMLIALACASCGGNNPPEANPPTKTLDPTSKSEWTKPTAQNTDPSQAASARLVPVAGAQWTILVHNVRGPAHIIESKRFKDQLTATTGLNQWYLIHGASDSTLYYGYYKEMSGESPDAARLKVDLDKIKELRDAMTDRPLFAQALVVGLDSADPVAPPEWNLASSGGHYTLVIGTYAGNIERKQAAVDVVRELRSQNIPAYYHHGDAASTVSIGAWPTSAADEGQAVENRDPSKRVIVAAGAPTPEVERAIEKAGREGAVTLTPSFVPRDPNMIAMMKEYPHLHTNGGVYVNKVKDQVTGQLKEIPDPSYIAVIPKQADSLLRNSAPAVVDPTKQADFGKAVFGSPDKPASPDKAKPAQLKSIGE